MSTFKISFSEEAGYIVFIEAETELEAINAFKARKEDDIESLVKDSKHRWSEISFIDIEEQK